MTFYQWLQAQVERNDVVGDFAYTVCQFEEPSTQNKRIKEHQKWASWLVDKKASYDVLDAFNKSWRIYQSEKSSA